jgi:dTDP-4-amino-4,6-dideoxy-D-galactose acyltransferase
MRYEILDWDTDFFGIKVGRFTNPQLELQELSEILSEMKKKNVKLVYFPAEKEIEITAAKRLGGFLADKKTTFAIDFSIVNLTESIPTDLVKPFKDSMSVKEFENLAIQSGELSRFAVDPNFPKDKFISLYKTWMKKSLQKEIASEVLFINDENRIAGVVTLGEKKGRGDIGLFAVDKKYRGKKFGEMLVRAAQKWFIDHGYKYGQVVTQGQNTPAGNLYKKCGYSVEKVEYFYHFWL